MRAVSSRQPRASWRWMRASLQGEVTMSNVTHTIRLHRVLRAPAERLYRAFLDPDAMAKWLPPHGVTGKVHGNDRAVRASVPRVPAPRRDGQVDSAARVHRQGPRDGRAGRRRLPDVVHALRQRPRSLPSRDVT